MEAGCCPTYSQINRMSAPSPDSVIFTWLQVTRGAQFPMVIVRTRLPDVASGSATIRADLEIQFVGQTAQYKQVPFQLANQGNQIRVSGAVLATLSDFKIDPPSLLTIPVKDEMPVRVEMTWRQ